MVQDIPVYQEYLGVTFPDVTVTRDMDIEIKNRFITVNQLDTLL